MYSIYITMSQFRDRERRSQQMAAMSVLRDSAETLPTGPKADDGDDSNPVLIHIRFRPDGSILHITDLPDHLSEDEWFKLLCSAIGGKYHTRAGGRGFFRTTRLELESISNPQQ